MSKIIPSKGLITPDPLGAAELGSAVSGGGPTSVEVAKAAGVSQSTVSLVMSGKAVGRVSAETRQRVEATARQLGYRPNASARMLRTGAARILALAVPNVQQPYFGQIFVAAEWMARENGHAIILIDATTDPDWAERLVEMLRSRLVAGCIVYASDERSEPILIEARDQILFIEAEDPETSDIDLDLARAMSLVVDHLSGLGHTRIGYFAADYAKATYRRRFEAFGAALSRLDLPFDACWYASSTFDLETATAQAARLLADRAVTALFCDDDLLAAAVYRAARQLSIAIPRDLSVIGFNDIELARIVSPELTTVSIPAEVIGRAAVRQLLSKLQSRSDVPSSPLVAELSLTVRGSTARRN